MKDKQQSQTNKCQFPPIEDLEGNIEMPDKLMDDEPDAIIDGSNNIFASLSSGQQKISGGREQRKSQNREAARQSRLKRKNYLESLREKVESYNRENSKLQKNITCLEDAHRSVIMQAEQTMAGLLNQYDLVRQENLRLKELFRDKTGGDEKLQQKILKSVAPSPFSQIETPFPDSFIVPEPHIQSAMPDIMKNSPNTSGMPNFDLMQSFPYSRPASDLHYDQFSGQMEHPQSSDFAANAQNFNYWASNIENDQLKMPDMTQLYHQMPAQPPPSFNLPNNAYSPYTQHHEIAGGMQQNMSPGVFLLPPQPAFEGRDASNVEVRKPEHIE